MDNFVVLENGILPMRAKAVIAIQNNTSLWRQQTSGEIKLMLMHRVFSAFFLSIH